MPTTYKLGDKQFQSTGDIGKDIELIKQNFPEVDTTTLQQSLSSPQSATQGSETTIKLPSDITNLKNYASQFDPTSKEYQKAMGAYEAERDDYLKLNPTAKPDLKQEDFESKLAGAGKNVKYAYDVLDQIETSSGDLPFLGAIMGAGQKAGDLMGVNPEVGQYQTIVNGILSTFARNVGQEKGAMSEGDVERAKSLFAPIYDNQKERDAKKQNALVMLKNADPSQDWEALFKEPSPFLKKVLQGQPAQQAPQSQGDPVKRYNPKTRQFEVIQ